MIIVHYRALLMGYLLEMNKMRCVYLFEIYKLVFNPPLRFRLLLDGRHANGIKTNLYKTKIDCLTTTNLLLTLII